MRVTALLFLVFGIFLFSSRIGFIIDPTSVFSGTIVPTPPISEHFSEEPTPILIRIINHGRKSLYLQGVQEGQGQRKIKLFFYHRGKDRGWKPFFQTLPCDLPTCKNLHALDQTCGQSVPFSIRIGPAGNFNSVKEFKWDGLLYQKIETIRERKNRRYCYKGWVPKKGDIRIELEFSKSLQNQRDKRGMIGGRMHTAIEFSLPPVKTVYEIEIGG
ncbi:MAG: hypothetical protein ACE5FY_00665 [Nitrospiria bacterium]